MGKNVAKESQGVNLAKVLWYYNLIPSTGVGSQKIVCPFHEDVNPSMLVNLDEGNWFCFGCNLSGDAAKFAKLYEAKLHGLNDLQACRKYQAILKSDKCSDVKPVVHNKKRAKADKELYAEAYDYYHGLKRVDWFRPDEPEAVEARSYMEHRGFGPTTLWRCGAKVTYNASYGLIFPMLDNGKFKGWVCRTMVPTIERQRKYLYNKGFARATTLVGDYGSHDYVIVVEGYMDRLKFVQFGVTNVVAILGWKMTAQQIEKLKAKGVSKIISALDNDECGRKGTKFLQKYFDVTRFCYLKGFKDPGEMLASDFEKMYSRTIAKFRRKGKQHGPTRQNQS